MKITELQKTDKSKYNTDKFGQSDLFNTHTYGEFYNNLCEKIRLEKLNILEVGVYYGGSVRLFHDYFKNSKIYGIDINKSWIDVTRGRYDRYFEYIMDAYDMENLNSISVDGFDIIVDDGPHSYQSQLYALNNFPSKLKENGLLVVEDIAYYNLKPLLDECNVDKDKITVYNYWETSNMYDDIIATIKG